MILLSHRLRMEISPMDSAGSGLVFDCCQFQNLQVVTSTCGSTWRRLKMETESDRNALVQSSLSVI